MSMRPTLIATAAATGLAAFVAYRLVQRNRDALPTTDSWTGGGTWEPLVNEYDSFDAYSDPVDLDPVDYRVDAVAHEIAHVLNRSQDMDAIEMDEVIDTYR